MFFSRIVRHNQISSESLSYFLTHLPSSSIITLPASLAPFNADWMGLYKGQSPLVLKPTSVAQVSLIMQHCSENNIAIVPQGGNTGLVGGSVPINTEVILSLSLLDKVMSFDETAGIISMQSGCILEKADSYLRARGHIMPLDLGAKGSCQVGGNLSTNAGGLRFLRYGSLHGTVLSIEVVLADGKIVRFGKKLRKDSTGYDMKQLFIGAEGSLGIVTEVTMVCPVLPKSVNVMVLGLDSYEKVVETFKETKKSLGEILSAFEFFDAESYLLTKKHLSLPRGLLDSESKFYVLIETQGSNAAHDSEKLFGLLETLVESEMVADGVLAQDDSQAKYFWSVREGISEACSKEGGVYKYDLSVPVKDIYSFVDTMKERLQGLISDGDVKDVVAFGHIGDGNLHLNIMTTGKSAKITNVIEPFIYELVNKMDGSISAEHGLGQMKKEALSYSKSEEEIKWMRQVKALFDPKGILNPGKYFPSDRL